MKEYNRVRETFEVLESQTMKTKLDLTIPEELAAIRNLTHFCETNLSRLEAQLTRKRKYINMSLSLVYESRLLKANICSGTLFSDEKIVLANHSSDKIGLFLLRLTNESWETEINSESYDWFFDVKHTENKIYSTNCSKKCVIIMTSDNFNKVGEFKMKDDLMPFGLALRRGFLFVACRNVILKYSLEGLFIYKYNVETGTLYVTVTDVGHIVYSNGTTDTVTCINEIGQTQWEYKHTRLKSPHSVDRDELDNLFICGSSSDNIHILSSNGTLIKIIEDIPCPAFIKMFKGIDMCCVCCNWKNIKIYRIK